MIFFNNRRIEFGQFPNGETYIKKPFFAEERVDVRNVVTLKYESDTDLFRLFLVKKSLWFPCDLRITYFPYSRMDRSSKEYIFTLKSVAKFINLMEWNRVIIYEPHSDVTPALLNHCTVVDVTAKLVSKIGILKGSTLTPYDNQVDYQLFFPDAGAQKRYESLSKGNDLIGFKKRDFATGKILEQQVIGERTTNTVVIVDDLCSKGGTFVLAAKKLREMGFEKIFLVVAHCEKTVFRGDALYRSSGFIDDIFTTDSILDTDEGFDNLHVFPLTGFKYD